jgi:mono/diheme cytochrome c family protein
VSPTASALLVVWLALPLAVAGCNHEPSGPKRPEGEQIFHDVCARCHGQDGTGGPPDPLGNPGPKNFNDPAFQSTYTDAQIRRTIENGNRGMPAFGAVFTPAQLELLVARVRKFGAPPRRDAP